MGQLLSINISSTRGVGKLSIKSAEIRENFGIVEDSHSGNWHRQVSFLDRESIDKSNRDRNESYKFGEFAENLTIEGVDLGLIKVGDYIKVGDATFMITQLGKDTHERNSVFYTIDGEIYPKEDIFDIMDGKKRSGRGVMETIAGGLMPKRGPYAVCLNSCNISVGDEIATSDKDKDVYALIFNTEKDFSDKPLPDDINRQAADIFNGGNISFMRIDAVHPKDVESRKEYLSSQGFDKIIEISE